MLESHIVEWKQEWRWDSLPLPGFTLDDISDQAIKHFKKLAAKKGRIPADNLDEPKEMLLERLGLIRNGHLTNAAMLLFSENPEKWQLGAYVKIGFFRNHADLEYQDEIRGPLIDQIDRVIEVVHLKYMKARITYEGIQRIERYFVPDEALREAILNAICHKDYSRSIPIQISVYEDRLYIGNVGQLPKNWTLDDLLGKHTSIPFNPSIANVFYLAGHIESWGRGIEKIFSACKAENVPEPTFKIHPGDIMIRFTAPEGFAELRVKVNDSQNVPQNVPQNGITGQEKKMSQRKRQLKIIELIKEDSKITRQDLAYQLGVTVKTIGRDIETLKKMNKLEYEGSAKTGQWILKDD